jgi:hypothetical protein
MKTLIRAALVSTFALYATASFATPARTAAMENHTLVEDDTDLFLFPGLTGHYGRAASLHVGAGGPQGGIIYGAEGGWQFGLFHGSRVGYNDLAQTSNTLGLGFLQPNRLPSFFAGKKSGDDLIGFGINPGFNLTRVLGPTNTNNGANYDLAFDIEGIFGFGTRNESVHSDTAIALSYHRFIQRVSPDVVADTPVFPSIAVRHRTFWLGKDGLDWGVYGEAARRDESYVQMQPFRSEAFMSRWVFAGGIGPRFRPSELISVAASLEMSFTTAGGRVDTTRFGGSTLAAPGFKVSVEAAPLKWLFLRAGATKRYVFNFSRPAAGGQMDTSADSFSWSTGAGVVSGNFEVDATISNALLTNGPSFIGGGAPGLFGGLSARIRY